MENLNVAAPVVTETEDGLDTWSTFPKIEIKHISDGLEISSTVFLDGIEIDSITHGFSSGYTFEDKELVGYALTNWVNQRSKRGKKIA